MIINSMSAAPAKVERSSKYLFAYIAASAAFCLCDLSSDINLVRLLIKSTLMPTLSLYFKDAFGRDSTTLVTASLIFAWAGDVFLDFEGVVGPGPWFLVGMVSFLLMQLCYLFAFNQLKAYSTGIPKAALVVYLALWIGANYVFGPKLGDLQPAVVVYSAALVTMAAVSSGLPHNIGIGGALFALSDFCILLRMGGMDFPFRSTVIQVTYVVAQYLIIKGWCKLNTVYFAGKYK